MKILLTTLTVFLAISASALDFTYSTNAHNAITVPELVYGGTNLTDGATNGDNWHAWTTKFNGNSLLAERRFQTQSNWNAAQTNWNATNQIRFSTSSNPTNAFVAETLYTNGSRAGLLVGFSYGGVLYYTNGAGYVLPVTNAFCVPLNPSNTFQFTGGDITNTVFWKQ